MKLNTLILSGLVAVAVAVVPAVASQKSLGPADEALALLKAVQARASDVETHAGELQRVADASSETHELALDAIKNDVNQMGRSLGRLEAIRNDATPEERAAIDHLGPMLNELAANAQIALNLLNDHMRSFWVPAYATRIDKLESVSNEVRANLGEVVQLVNVAAREKRLEKTVGVAGD